MIVPPQYCNGVSRITAAGKAPHCVSTPPEADGVTFSADVALRAINKLHSSLNIYEH